MNIRTILYHKSYMKLVLNTIVESIFDYLLYLNYLYLVSKEYMYTDLVLNADIIHFTNLMKRIK